MIEFIGYSKNLKEEIAAWANFPNLAKDAWWPLIQKLPHYFDAMANLYQDLELTADQKRIVRRVLKYLISPLDLMPEYIYGPEGYREDFYLLALAAKQWSTSWNADLTQRHGLRVGDDALIAALELGVKDLNEDIRRHLDVLLNADSIAGDEVRQGDHHSAMGEGHPVPEQNTIVFAGPGTGKTYRIEMELKTLLTDKTIAPDHVLVTTFTNKAADELRLRVRQRLSGTPGIASPDKMLQKLSISTIHAFCYHLIEEFHHHLLFIKGTFSSIDETQRLVFLFHHGIGPLRLKEIYNDWREQQRLAGRHDLDLFVFYRHVSRIYDFLSEEVIGGDDKELRRHYLKIRYGTPETIEERIIHTYPEYWRKLQEEGHLDHSMVLAYVEALLSDPQVLAQVQKKYQYLLVDEYQDTNPIQDRIFRKIIGRTGRLFAVADDDQSIYAFRGADVRNATQFEKRYKNTVRETLSEHRRSTQALLNETQSLIKHNKIRIPKDLHTKNSQGELPWRLEADEAQLPIKVAQLCKGLKDRGTIKQWQEVALLFRGMNKRVLDYKAAFQKYDIPFSNTGDRQFLSRPLINSLVGLFDMIKNDAHEITSRKRKHKIFFETMGWTDKEEILAVLKRWNNNLHGKEPEYDSLIDLFYAILKETGAIAKPEVLPDLGRFSSLLAEVESQIGGRDLVKRLDYFLRLVKASNRNIDGPAVQEREGVQVMTIHKSKGLEFPVVIIADALDTILPAHFPPDPKIELRCLLGGKSDCPDVDEEERRILYVGMTRAENLCILATTPDNPSRFLKEFKSMAAPENGQGVLDLGKAYVAKSPTIMPIHAAHSHLYNYHFCPKRYLLENRYGFAGRVITPLRAGMSLHRALEIFHRLRLEGESVPPDRRERIWERAWVAPAKKKEAEKERQQLLDIFEHYAQGLENDKTIKLLELEQPFYIAEGDGVLTGKIDLVRERHGQMEIVEFKFHNNPMLPDYPVKQLEHYSLAYPEDKPSLVVHYLQEDKEKAYPCRDKLEIREEIKETFSKIRQGYFEPQPGKKKCQICPMQHVCADREGETGMKMVA